MGPMIEFDHEVYYHDPHAIDLAKVRAEAEFRLIDRRGGPQTTRIHFHAESYTCNGWSHEEYYPAKEE
jgi:hypothetical protein